MNVTITPIIYDKDNGAQWAKYKVGDVVYRKPERDYILIKEIVAWHYIDHMGLYCPFNYLDNPKYSRLANNDPQAKKLKLEEL